MSHFCLCIYRDYYNSAIVPADIPAVIMLDKQAMYTTLYCTYSVVMSRHYTVYNYAAAGDVMQLCVIYMNHNVFDL